MNRCIVVSYSENGRIRVTAQALLEGLDISIVYFGTPGAKQVSTLLLQTKLYIPPARPELVSRPRLIERLNAGLHRKLTLVSAPADFGKTTLLSEWIPSGVNGREYGEGEEHELAGLITYPSGTWSGAAALRLP